VDLVEAEIVDEEEAVCVASTKPSAIIWLITLPSELRDTTAFSHCAGATFREYTFPLSLAKDSSADETAWLSAPAPLGTSRDV
jgi:hypothetical protein